MTTAPIKTALISVSNKTGLLELATCLIKARIKIISSGGTYAFLQKNSIEATEIAEITQMPEMMGGRIKTLHPKIHGGILARRNQDESVASQHQIEMIDLVVVNLYPFAQTIAKEDCTLSAAIENIDIGGPAMLRSAAKNHKSVAAVVDVADYDAVIDQINASGAITTDFRYYLAVKTFKHTAKYDALVYEYLLKQSYKDTASNQSAELVNLSNKLADDEFLLYGQKCNTLRYGENPKQKAALYANNASSDNNIVNAEQIAGIELSFNNWVDADSANACVNSIEKPACVIVKHANPCGAAYANDLEEAYTKAYKADSIAAFGGVIAFNRPISSKLLQTIIEQQFVEVIIAPQIAGDKAQLLEIITKKPKLRILLTNALANDDENNAVAQLEIKALHGGFLVQEALPNQKNMQAETMGKVSWQSSNNDDVLLAWQLVSFVKSNAIVLVKDGQTIGIGCGQTSRVASVQLAINNAKAFGFSLENSVLASDAFFPFRDSIDKLADYGISAIIQPGGSMRDGEVIEAADEHNIAMLFTKDRVFKH